MVSGIGERLQPDHPPCIEIHHHGRIGSRASHPHRSEVTTPHLMRGQWLKGSFQSIGHHNRFRQSPSEFGLTGLLTLQGTAVHHRPSASAADPQGFGYRPWPPPLRDDCGDGPHRLAAVRPPRVLSPGVFARRRTHCDAPPRPGRLSSEETPAVVASSLHTERCGFRQGRQLFLNSLLCLQALHLGFQCLDPLLVRVMALSGGICPASSASYCITHRRKAVSPISRGGTR